MTQTSNDSRSRAQQWLIRAEDLLRALSHATADPPYADLESNLCERLVVQAFEDVTTALRADLAHLKKRFRDLDRWCDERRNAPDVTTLGMIQEKLREGR